ncbi:MAG: polysaccharide lyase family 7 protein [Verrucomicrobiales bacterium]|nr:polysaccharide lyase family 7 protein [Verrucomicrobiales bacterium]
MNRWLTAVLALGLIGDVAAKDAGDVINLSIWKLIIPMDDNGDDVADEVTMPTLRLFEDPDFFHLSEDKDSVVFRARSDAPKSEGSKYPRSELREMKKGGTVKTSWGTNDGKVHNLTFSAAFLAAPDQSRDVVCARIGDSEKDLLTVRLKDRKLLIDRENSKPVILDDNYEPGTFFNLMIIADNGRIRALYERKQIMEWEVEHDGLFFRVGCQTRSAPEKGDKPESFGETAFKSVFVTHK